MKVAYRNFSGGEVAQSLAARYDLGKYTNTLRHAENLILELHGPMRKRMGTYFLEDIGGPGVLIPFEFSSDPSQNYVLILQGGTIRVAQGGGFVRNASGTPVTMAAPYKEAELYDVYFAQSGDILYLTHTGHALRKISRYSHTDWRIETVSFSPALSPPSKVTVAFSGSAGGYPIRYKVVAVDEKGRKSVAANGVQPDGKHASDWVIGDYATISWPAVKGAKEYNIYRQSAGSTYGLVGVTEELKFRDDNYSPDTSDTPAIPQDPFTQGNNPGVVCFHQQRLILGAPLLEPQKWYGSRTGDYEDFSKSRPVRDDDSLEFVIASGRIDRIQWMSSFGDLLIGSAGSEYKAIGADQGTITPSSLNVREQSYWGSVKLRPLIIGNSVLHVQRQGSRVRDLFYSLEKDGYSGNDLSVFAPHLFDNHLIRQWDYQQAPGSLVLAVRDDGVMLAMTYMKEHDIWGWSRFSTVGAFRSVCCTAGSLQDDIYTIVERTVGGAKKYYLERFMPRRDAERDDIKDAFYVDCGLTYNNPAAPVSEVSGLGHLEGMEVAILVDGSPIGNRTVKDGTITLDYPGGVIHAGLPYTFSASPQTPEADTNEGATLGRVRSYGQCTLGLLGSVGGKYGASLDRLYDLPAMPSHYDTAVEPFTGYMDFTPNGRYGTAGNLWIVHDLPLPFTVTSMILDVDIEG